MNDQQTIDEAACGGSALTAELGDLPPVLDACCGSRMFWFDRQDSRAVFVDKRRERHTLPDVSSKGGSRELVIDPDHQADFTDLPFPDEAFALVVFDPPHFERNGATGWVGLKYGTLKGEWRDMLRDGFAECFRVLRPEGVLIFKWCEDEIPVSQILALTPEKPLIGHRSGKQQKTHWIAFMKAPECTCAAKDMTFGRCCKLTPNKCKWCGHDIHAHDKQYGCAEDGCDCETPNAIELTGAASPRPSETE